MTTATLHAQASAQFNRQKITAIAVPLIVLAYFAYIFVSFDMAGLKDRINLNNAKTLVSDTYSYKTHVTQSNSDGSLSIAVEGERKGQYPDGAAPNWVSLGTATNGETTTVDLGQGHLITLGSHISYDIPGYGVITAQPDGAGVNAVFPAGDMPDYISASKNRVMIKSDAGRFTITRSRAEVFKYSFGWELFFFTLDSPYHGMGVGQLVSHAIGGEFGAIIRDIWTN
ncbi:MAG: phosphonate transport system permease protein, partial [Celeribacter sp.]